MSSNKIKIKGDDLERINIYGYSVGHVINDITCTLCFNYLLYFLTEIIQISNVQAGWVSFFGQIANAILSLIIGILVDKYQIRYLEKKTTWYLKMS